MNIVCANLLQKALPIKTFIKVYRLFNLQTSTAVRGGGTKALLLIKKALKIPELLSPSFSTVVNTTMLKKKSIRIVATCQELVSLPPPGLQAQALVLKVCYT